MSYESTIDYIENSNWIRTKPGLERTQALLKALGNPEKQLKFVHIGGTNGKGSTAACIAAVLQHAGYRTGLYTSPYILRFNERMQINGRQIADDELERLVDRIRPIADAMEDKPTEFELITAIGMQYFYENQVDIVVLEVGLGGELDSTNVIDTPECAVITAIGLDHTELLGDTLPKIAATKAGIIKQGGLAVAYPAEADVVEVLKARCDGVGAKLTMADVSRLNVKSVTLDGVTFDFDGIENIFLPLAGSYQPYNAAVAITACRLLRQRGWNITDDCIHDGLAEVYWPGRFEVLLRSPVFVLDGAHNPHGIRATVESLKTHFGDKKLIFVIGVMADKDVETMAECVAPLAEIFYTARPNNTRSMSAADLAELLRRHGADAIPCDSVKAAVASALEHAGREGVVMALGSLYFSSDIRAAVEELTK